MKVSGFSFVRNAIRFDYPVKEALTSILPLCDEIVVAVGDSEDETLELVRSVHPEKIRIIETKWDPSLRKGGTVLAAETNKALQAVDPASDWAFYIQADEVLHEQYHDPLLASMEKWRSHQKVEGLLFDYLHFYGSYDFVGNSRRWYAREVRIVRPHIGIYSFRDAQGFQRNNRPLRVKMAHATMYHYGWVRPPDVQQKRQAAFHALWHDDDWVEKHVKVHEVFDYSRIDSLANFTGKHPSVMQPRIIRRNWTFSFDPASRKPSLRNRLLAWLRKTTGWRLGEYRNYRLVKD